jgi:UDP-hydrolysing UDP-N-acetyl-D-glucosamine 2-epimerase
LIASANLVFVPQRRRICFVTGTRAEFGLMRGVLRNIQKSKRLKLQIVVTGMHLDRRHGRSLARVGDEGWNVDAVVPWQGRRQAVATGHAIAALARVFARLKPDVILAVGDRVEGLAAATAGHLCGLAVAHVHGGDRALGQVDDSLRHAITKLSHVHFAATGQSATRLLKLGEDPWRIHQVGSPGIDGIARDAASPRQVAAQFPGLRPRQFALLVLHPLDADENLEFKRADTVLRAVAAAGVGRIVIIYPNNDPGSGGIIRRWRAATADKEAIVRRDVSRPIFLALLRDAAMLVGNSSSGVIEAASFATSVIDVGNRQRGRQRCQDVRHVPYQRSAILAAARAIWNGGRPRRGRCRNPYQGLATARKITRILQNLTIDPRLLKKLIAY